MHFEHYQFFSAPSFISGMSRVLDIGATFTEYNSSNDPDTNAIYNDWFVVGEDLRKVCSNGKKEKREE